ncbi:ATPase, T2SS/T4P/T4SS family [Achromobacter deleyi]|uniref:ATPase, T2SS/T4P/T4SS family n=1 Tax=Achromobacter deleyi TaxID=1353891 RepID=UPI0014915943|nr:ATPase, T2SS/T4P/T4SS family [Achromobacter deleyi]QVQ29196.1 Flp pilus assembly complex ATPase component TadA [Achromobacter deleyi]UIP19316.1 Flp pilus assembly complex ATPase component TadA [Achromobacter deleyi]
MTTQSLPTALAARPPELRSPEDIERLEPAFVRALRGEFDLAALAGRLCPVLLEGGQAAVFAVKEYTVGDQIDEVERMVRAAGYRMAQPSRYALPAPLLLMIARGQFMASGPGRWARAKQAERASALAALFLDIVRWGVVQGASDVHINVNQRRDAGEIRYTIHGEYVGTDRFTGLSSSTLLDVLAVAWMDVRGGNGAVFDPALEQQGRIALDLEAIPIVLRWASLAADAGPSVCLRILRLDATVDGDLRALGYLPGQAETLLRAREREGGAIVLAGVVGSGKSTTIAALMRGIAPTRKVITLEDPVEYHIGNALQNTLAGALADSAWPALDAKLKTIKRSAMNDLLIGEIRDTHTGRAFMDLASSGVSLYATTHAGSAAMIPERLASDAIGVSREFLASPGILKLLVYQTLLPRLCNGCSLPVDSLWGAAQRHQVSGAGWDWRGWVREMQRAFELDADTLRVRNAAGCPECRREQLPELNGTAGRSVAAEMVEPERADGFLDRVRKRDNLGLKDMVQAAGLAAWREAPTRGVRALDCALYKVSLGEIDPRTLLRRFDLPVMPNAVGVEPARGAHG